MFTCLFASSGHDLRALIRGGASDEELAALIASVWRRRDDRYSEIRSEETAGTAKVEMSHIGG
jgi:cyclic pyranopterin phosphate synthase